MLQGSRCLPCEADLVHVLWRSNKFVYIVVHVLSKKNKKNYRYTQRLKNDRTIKMNCDTSEGLIVVSISNINTFNML